jgi:hypothetical protein
MPFPGIQLTVGSVFFSVLFDVVGCQAVFLVDPEVIAALLPRLHVAVLHGEVRLVASFGDNNDDNWVSGRVEKVRKKTFVFSVFFLRSLFDELLRPC